jgi:hypothetical protein
MAPACCGCCEHLTEMKRQRYEGSACEKTIYALLSVKTVFGIVVLLGAAWSSITPPVAEPYYTVDVTPNGRCFCAT